MVTGNNGTIVSTRGYAGEPDFVSPDAGDYHIGENSAAIDLGVDAGVTQDKDGLPRPQGAAPDLGAYEFTKRYTIYLPLVMRNR